MIDIKTCNLAENIEPLSEIDFDKKYVKEQIRRFSHYKEYDEISKFFESQYEYDGSAFIGKRPISVIKLIGEGISHFAELKYKDNMLKE